LLAEVAVQAGRHIARLEPGERARLLALVRQARGRPGALAEHEREELLELVARMEPHVFLASATARVTPFPVPRRLVEHGARVIGRSFSGRR
jgi:hypothetical protein